MTKSIILLNYTYIVKTDYYILYKDDSPLKLLKETKTCHGDRAKLLKYKKYFYILRYINDYSTVVITFNNNHNTNFWA